MLPCPLCSALLPPAALEAHLRGELGYTTLRCLLCPLRFFTHREATAHFAGRFADHPGSELRIAQERDWDKERRLEELLDKAQGGEGRGCQSSCGCCQRLRELERRLAQSSDKEEPKPVSYEPDAPAQAEAQGSEAEAPPQPQFPPPQAFPQPPLPPPLAFKVKSEALEPRPEAPQDVKPALSVDGKVSCLLCSLRVSRDGFRRHAMAAHSAAQPFLCALCPATAKDKSTLKRHLKTAHEAEPSEETMTVLGLRKEEERQVELCFGAMRTADYAKSECRECQVSVRKLDRKEHAAQKHLKKPLHACRLCPFTSDYFSRVLRKRLVEHLKREHKQGWSSETASSQVDKYDATVRRIVAQLFA